jgi:hypothetical protein
MDWPARLLDPTCSRIAARKMASAVSKPLAAITRPAMSSVLSSSPAAVRTTSRAEPRQLVPREISIAPIDPLRSDGLWIEIGRQHAERTVNVRQIRSVLVKLTLHLIDDTSQFAALGDQPVPVFKGDIKRFLTMNALTPLAENNWPPPQPRDPGRRPAAYCFARPAYWR